MSDQPAPQPFDEETSVNPSTLSNLALFLGWLGAHRFYIGDNTLGAFYYALLVFGIVFTVYVHLWEGILLLLAPFVISFIEFLRFRRMSQGEIARTYQRATGENQTIVYVAQIIFLILLFIPLLMRVFS